jgi:hypothetical protein
LFIPYGICFFLFSKSSDKDINRSRVSSYNVSSNVVFFLFYPGSASEERITFFNVLSCPGGLQNLLNAYPKVKIVTGHVDEGLNEKSFLVPGLG